MNIQTIVTFIVGLIFGGGIAAIITLLLVKVKHVEAISDIVRERDGALQSLKERDLTVSGHKAELEKVRSQSLASADRVIATEADGFRRLLSEKELALAAILQEKDIAIEQQKRLLVDTERILSEKFSALSLESLKSANDEFLKLAGERFDKAGEISKAELEKRQQGIDELLKPVFESLDKLGKQHQEIEEKRVSAFDSIEKGIKNLSNEADQLANALRKPTSRGAWGEMNLLVILENAGLVQGEHFVLQHSTSDDEGGLARTDVVLHLPNGRHLIIDSKAPLEAYWEGMNAADEITRLDRFAAHARLVKEHSKKLSSKSYWSRYPSSPDFTIMFLPTEGTYQAAVESDRTIVGEAQKHKIYITSPMTLMSMIHVIAFVLREERLTQNAQQVQDIAGELYRRIAVFVEHLDRVGGNLRTMVNSYNSAVGSLDSRVLPAARKMNALGGSAGEDLPVLAPVEAVPRMIISQDHLQIPELSAIEIARSDLPKLQI